MKSGRARRRKRGVLGAVFADALAAKVEVPRQALARAATYDLMVNGEL